MTPLKWPDAITASQGGDAELTVTKLTNTRWLASPEMNKPAAEVSIETFLSDLGIGKLPIRWIDKNELGQYLQAYEIAKDPIWPMIYDIPQKIKEAADAQGNKGAEILAFTLNDVPEYLFHDIYDAAYRAFEQQGGQVISHVTAAALYIAGLSAAWDALCEGDNPLSGLLQTLQLGYLPLGVKDGAFCVH